MPSFIMFGFFVVAFAAASDALIAIDLVNFGEGDAIVGKYTVPSSSRTKIDLQDDTGRVVLHVDYRKDWTYLGKRWQDTLLVISANVNGGWDWANAKTIGDFDYTPGTDITFKIEAKSSAFDIKVNSEFITSFDYVVPVDKISRAYMNTEATDCELKSLGVEK